jgi:hypothetical protein
MDFLSDYYQLVLGILLVLLNFGMKGLLHYVFIGLVTGLIMSRINKKHLLFPKYAHIELPVTIGISGITWPATAVAAAVVFAISAPVFAILGGLICIGSLIIWVTEALRAVGLFIENRKTAS